MDDFEQRLRELEGRVQDLEDEWSEFLRSMKRDGPPAPKLSSARKLVEKALIRACEDQEIEVSRRPSFEELKTTLAKEGLMDDRVRAYVSFVQSMGNIGSHPRSKTRIAHAADAEFVMRAILHVLDWYREQESGGRRQDAWSKLRQLTLPSDGDRIDGYRRLKAAGPGGDPPQWLIAHHGLEFSREAALDLLCSALEVQGCTPARARLAEVRNGSSRGFMLNGEDGDSVAVLHGSGPHFGRTFVTYRGIGGYYLGWAGGPTGWLGFPVSDEYRNAQGARSDFQFGHVQWDGEERLLELYRGQGADVERVGTWFYGWRRYKNPMMRTFRPA